MKFVRVGFAGPFSYPGHVSGCWEGTSQEVVGLISLIRAEVTVDQEDLCPSAILPDSGDGSGGSEGIWADVAELSGNNGECPGGQVDTARYRCPSG